MVASGVPIADVSRILGHANPAITLRIYAHATPDGLERAADVMDAALANGVALERSAGDGAVVRLPSAQAL